MKTLAVSIALFAALLPPGTAGRVGAAPVGTDDWPMFHHDALHSGVSEDTTIASSNVSSLRLQWQANTGGDAVSSPAVAYNASLGKSLVYEPNGVGVMNAYDAATGERVWWSRQSNSDINSSPAKDGNVIYYGSKDKNLYALNATTGALICKFSTGGVISSSPVVADPGTGKVVYVGDNGIGGADDGGALWAINAIDPNPAADCSLKWKYDAFGNPPGSQGDSGSWSPPGFAIDANGRPLVVFGGSSPDNAVYALDAKTGARVWRFQTEVFAPDNDVGAGPAISAPGVNGFAQGVVYITGKNGIVYALNLTTGEKIWEFRIRNNSSDSGHTRQTAALLGARVYVPYGQGVYALNAVTGAKVYKTADVGPATAEVSSPAITGPEGDRVMVVADLAGDVIAFDLATGVRRWSYRTSSYAYASVAISQGKIFAVSADGFLYAFGLGGGASAPPDTTIVSPADGSDLPRPAGQLQMSGRATDDLGVDRVLIAIKNNNGGMWWDGSTGSWTKVFSQNVASLTNPGQGSTQWTYSFPVPTAGGAFFSQAEAVDTHSQHDAPVATSKFSVASSGNPPNTAIVSPVKKQVFRFPLSGRVSFPITVTGTATDSGGPEPGISLVKVVIKNIEHGEYYCGSPTCHQGTSWKPSFAFTPATLEEPGATATNWTVTFPTYDHPHKYAITAIAVDEDGEQDPTKAVVRPICVRDPGENCAQT